MGSAYGTELVLDLNGCPLDDLSESSLRTYFVELCKLIGMNRHGEPMYWTDNSGTPHLHGVSAVQFIETSNVVCHALPLRRAVYINIFSCGEFDVEAAKQFSATYWRATDVHATVLIRR